MHTVPFKSPMYIVQLYIFEYVYIYSPFRQQFYKMMRYNTSDIELLCIIVASLKLRACVCQFLWTDESMRKRFIDTSQYNERLEKKVFHIHVMFMHIS